MKDCCLRVWLLNLLNAVLSCSVWCLDNDALHEKIYLFMISAYDRQEVCLVHFCWNFVLSVQFFFSFFLKFEQHFQSALSSRSCVCPAGRSARNQQSVTKQNLTSRSAAGRIRSLSLFTSWEKTTGAWIIIQPNIDAVWAANSWLALSLPLFYCGAHDKYFKRAQELGLRCYQMFVCQVESRL